jgi:pimeloyl-ACP methyl ester carboxylesterase
VALALGVEGTAHGHSRVEPATKAYKITYRAHNGKRTNAWVLLPSWYAKDNNPEIPLIISPHGRGRTGRQNARVWGQLPATGVFAVINPDGQGRKHGRLSWGYSRQIDDLARMPQILRATMPWLRIDRSRIYAFGGSMGGQESLLLAARHPKLLAGVAAFSSVTDFEAQYRAFPKLRCTRVCRTLFRREAMMGRTLQKLAREEVGGAPRTHRRSWATRSPLTYARRLAKSCLPIQLWWSRADRIVQNQFTHQSGKLFWKLRALNPSAPVSQYVGHWIHTAEMKASTNLPLALANFDLLPYHFADQPPALYKNEPRWNWRDYCG